MKSRFIDALLGFLAARDQLAHTSQLDRWVNNIHFGFVGNQASLGDSRQRYTILGLPRPQASAVLKHHVFAVNADDFTGMHASRIAAGDAKFSDHWVG